MRFVRYKNGKIIGRHAPQFFSGDRRCCSDDEIAAQIETAVADLRDAEFGEKLAGAFNRLLNKRAIRLENSARRAESRPRRADD